MPPNLDLRKMEAIQEMLRTRNDIDNNLIRFHQTPVKFKGFMVCSYLGFIRIAPNALFNGAS